MKPVQNKEALAVGAAQGSGNTLANLNNGDSRLPPLSAQALKVIDGERQAREFLARLRAQQADAHELGVIVSMLYGPTLRGFCSVLVKALEVAHG